MRNKRDGRCTQCGEPALSGARCLKHLVLFREQQRNKHRARRRYSGAMSYRLQTTG